MRCNKNRHLINIKDVEHSASSTERKVKPIFSNLYGRNQLGEILHLGFALFPSGGSEECKLYTNGNSCTLGLLPEEEQLYSVLG